MPWRLTSPWASRIVSERRGRGDSSQASRAASLTDSDDIHAVARSPRIARAPYSSHRIAITPCAIGRRESSRCYRQTYRQTYRRYRSYRQLFPEIRLHGYSRFAAFNPVERGLCGRFAPVCTPRCFAVAPPASVAGPPRDRHRQRGRARDAAPASWTNPWPVSAARESPSSRLAGARSSSPNRIRRPLSLRLPYWGPLGSRFRAAGPLSATQLPA